MHSPNSRSSRSVRPRDMYRLSRRTAMQAAAGGIALAGTAAGMSSSPISAQSTPEGGPSTTLAVPVYPYGQTLSLNPHTAINWGPHWILLPNVWAGLLRFDENGAVVPDMASSVEPEDEGAVWVATIRSGATHASGNPVTSESLVSAWKRALNPGQTAPMAGYMQRVQGYDDYVSSDSEELGFDARDESTVAIRLSEPYALFPEDLATFVWAAMDTTALEGVSASAVPFSDASAGPWRFVESDDDAEIVMQLNPNAESTPPTSFDTVRWELMTGPEASETALSAYRDGEIEIADMPPSLKATIQQNDEVIDQLETIELSGSTMLIGMDFRQAPFDIPSVRLAVAAAIDRDRWASEIVGGAFNAARSLTPPVLEVTANYSAPEPIPFDPEAAKAALADAGIDSESMPQITYFQPASSSAEEIEQAAALLAMIQENAGLVIEHDTTLTEDQITARRNDDGGAQFDIRWWWPHTNSPSGLAELGSPTSPSMEGWFNWSSDLEDDDLAEAANEFANHIDEAERSLESPERNRLYAQAEELLIQSAVYVPLGYGVQSYVQSPALTGTRQGAFTGYAPVAFDEDVTLAED